MRPGLVVIGVGLIVLAAASVVILFWTPHPGSTTTNTTSTSWTVPAGSENSTTIIGLSDVSGTFSVHWQATQPITASLYTSGGCGSTGPTSTCPLQLRITWSDRVAGNWSVNGPVGCPCLFAWSNGGSVPSSIVLTTVTTDAGTAAFSPLSELVLGLGAGVLGFGGGIALFLGLFLRGGVYAGPRNVVPHHPDDTPPGRERSAPGDSKTERH